MKIGLQRVEDTDTSNNLQKIVSSLGETQWGGTGIDTSASTGYPSVSAGVWSIGTYVGNSNMIITPTGGFAVKRVNRTGHTSVKGELVKSSTSTAGEVVLTGANDDMCIGCIYNAGVAEGSDVWVVIGGLAEVLFDASGCTLGYFVCTSATAGRADGTNASPPTTKHWQEIGHANTAASANGLGTIFMHFN